MEIKNESIEVSFKNLSTNELVFKTESQPFPIVNTNDQPEEKIQNSSKYTVHTTDNEGVTRYFDLVGIVLNPKTVTLEIKKL